MNQVPMTIPDLDPKCFRNMTPRATLSFPVRTNRGTKSHEVSYCCPEQHYLEFRHGAPICRSADRKSWCQPWKYQNGLCQHSFHSFNSSPYYNMNSAVTEQWPDVAKAVNIFRRVSPSQ